MCKFYHHRQNPNNGDIRKEKQKQKEETHLCVVCSLSSCCLSLRTSCPINCNNRWRNNTNKKENSQSSSFSELLEWWWGGNSAYNPRSLTESKEILLRKKKSQEVECWELCCNKRNNIWQKLLQSNWGTKNFAILRNPKSLAYIWTVVVAGACLRSIRTLAVSVKNLLHTAQKVPSPTNITKNPIRA